MKKQGIVTLGDAFIDYLSTNPTNKVFEKKLGGASVNVTVHLSRLEIPSYYITKLGENEDSHFVQKEMEKECIHLDYSVHASEKEICGVYVHLDEKGERNFHSYINNTPDDVLEEKDIVKEAFQHKKIFYFGSGTLFHPKARKATEKAVRLAKDNNLIISFDANIRLSRWKSEQECKKTIKQFLHAIDVFKLSEEELLFLFETSTVEEGIKRLKQYRIPVVFITMGEKGAYGMLFQTAVKVSSNPIEAKDTNGAGDAFMAAILYRIYKEGMPASLEVLKGYVQSGCILGAMVAAKMGALPLIGNYKSILASHPK